MKFTKMSQQSGSGGKSNLFLRLDDGESVKVALRGEVFSFFSKWVDGKSQVATPDDPEGRRRFRVNAVVRENNTWVVKIFEFGQGLSNKFADIQETLQSVDPNTDITKFYITISKHGSGKENTKWDAKCSGLIKEPGLIDSLPLNILNKTEQPKPKSSSDRYSEEPFPGPDDEIPF